MLASRACYCARQNAHLDSVMMVNMMMTKLNTKTSSSLDQVCKAALVCVPATGNIISSSLYLRLPPVEERINRIAQFCRRLSICVAFACDIQRLQHDPKHRPSGSYTLRENSPRQPCTIFTIISSILEGVFHVEAQRTNAEIPVFRRIQ